MHMVRYERPFNNLTLLLSGQSVKNLAPLPTYLAEQYLAPSLGHEHPWYLLSHLEGDRFVSVKAGAFGGCNLASSGVAGLC
jgi:hypothetical protein